MKISAVHLSWFRGAAHGVRLSTDHKNVVVYGSNGSGKSSFADAVEYVVRKGKISHLAHEYSGKRHEKGIINTHTPSGSNASLCITFEGDIRAEATLATDGTPTFTGDSEGFAEYVQTWRLEHLLLRQDEVAAFVVDTKGGKYSVLLPLLGLEGLELAAENIAALRRSIEKTGDLAGKLGALDPLKRDVLKHLPDVSEEAAMQAIEDLWEKYLDIGRPPSLHQSAVALKEAIEKRVGSLTPEIRRHTLIKGVCDEDLAAKFAAMLDSEQGILAEVDELLDSRIEVLEASARHGERIDPDVNDIKCPACGKGIPRKAFLAHVQSELEALKDLRTARDEATRARSSLASAIDLTLTHTKDDSIVTWLELDEQKELKQCITELDRLQGTGRWKTASTVERGELGEAVAAVDSAFRLAAERIPPSSQQLIEDAAKVETFLKVPVVNRLQRKIDAISGLVAALDSAESDIREEIRARTTSIIQSISANIQALWSRLHPNEPIENVELYLPEDSEKSVDIGLKFFGVEQDSPRLTLSEGHRNSLGLCIFIALASAGGGSGRPIILDDIVSSLDRGHRGNVTRLLMEDLSERQVLLLTHDREWFQELRVVLPCDKWRFLVLRPWTSPDVGIQWADSEDTFDDARSLINLNCEAAGNCVRQIMDTSLAIAAEKLRVPMPYARGDRNDHRTCVEFLGRIAAEAKERLRKRDNGSWLKYSEPLDDWKVARDLLIALANRGSHTGSLVPDEVEVLIQACEVALNRFKCAECGDYIWRADDASRSILQCRCGSMQWRY